MDFLKPSLIIRVVCGQAVHGENIYIHPQRLIAFFHVVLVFHRFIVYNFDYRMTGTLLLGRNEFVTRVGVFFCVWGIMGAAIASLVTQIFTNVALNFIVWPMRRTNVLMLKALNPKLLFGMAKSLKGNKQSEEESEKN